MNRLLTLAALLAASGCYVGVNMGSQAPTTSGTSSTTNGGGSSGTTSGGSASVTCTPLVLDFGAVAVGIQPAPTQLVTCTNTGTQTALLSVNAGSTISQFSVSDASGPIASNVQHSLSPGGSYVFNVAFEPSAAGTVTSTVAYMVCSSATVCFADEIISLEGVGASSGGCQLSVAPAELSFGTATSDDATSTLSATLSNIGTTTCEITDVAIVPGSNASYALASTQQTSFSVAAGATASITVEFTPGSTAGPVTLTGTLDLTLNDPNQAQLTIPLTGAVGVSTSAYSIVPIDATVPGQTQFAIAIGPLDDVGIAYFRPSDAGQTLVYASIQNGALQNPECLGADCGLPNTPVNTVQLALGVSVAFQPNGLPAIGYLGGGSYNGGSDAGGTLYWTQSQAEIDYQQASGGWTQDLCMISSTGGSCQEPSASCSSVSGFDGPFNWTIDYPAGTEDTNAELLCNNVFGEVVGLWPSLLFDGGTAVMSYRDVHEGQFPVQDWEASDAKMCVGGPGGSDWSWSAPLTLSANGNPTSNGLGVHNQLVYANGLLAEIADSAPKDEGSEASGAGPLAFTLQTGSNTQSNADWTPPIDPFDPMATGNTILNPGTGPSMVYGHSFVDQGFNVVATDIAQASPPLYFVDSLDGVTWSAKQTIYQSGSGGFFPQIAMNPNDGNPVVSFTICSLGIGATPQSGCTADAELDVAEPSTPINGPQQPSTWQTTTIVKGSFWHPRFGYLSTGKKVFVYSDLVNGGLYAAIEN